VEVRGLPVELANRLANIDRAGSPHPLDAL
jgi:hypothetical protein